MKKIIYVLGILFLTAACNEDSLADLNTDTKNPLEVPANTLFVTAQKNIVDEMTTPNYNMNIYRLVCQQWTETTYVDESNYNWTGRSISDNHWKNFYALPLADLDKAKEIIEKQVFSSYQTTLIAQQKNQLALIDLLTCYSYTILVDTFGDVPYNEALLGSENYLPKYDKSLDIYKNLIVRIDNDLAKIDVNHGAFGSSDFIGNDDMNQWIKFANCLKLKIGINLKASGLANSIADAAIISASKNVITSNDQNIKFVYENSGPNTNPVFRELSARNDFVVTETIVNHLVGKNDPRVTEYFADNKIPYVGGKVGVKNSYSKFTHVSDKIRQPNFPSTLFDLAETEFLLAEAVERGIAVGGTAQDHYNKAITASMKDWEIADADITAYLAQPNVAYTTAASTWQQKIGEQAWYALFNRGFEAYTSTRRLNYPVLNAPASADPAANGQVPSRMQYPTREQTLNPTNYNAAAKSIGGDLLTTKIFWDVN
ncbi:SusD/RagB family nutrient-binding outer membrane lipoprotein [Flavobacterium gilvum]|uniref:SusD/RagB family nutrient-binding outer membrane lipoprotein n=1 Tax=Flavobacterium gilvum TaxID=1492737 RepID=A0AAC9I620_9FLAO|nr:SusD/RagB family nutrient-binding outer membrane lipoprotein [Flavobacterium gilvum]AOW11104.1 hypothetical protein EM308_17345 [Flavobacterium gilvum]KFC61030.1 hypothetical protein FEM08_01520 [Flavobacterium gilvum]